MEEEETGPVGDYEKAGVPAEETGLSSDFARTTSRGGGETPFSEKTIVASREGSRERKLEV